ncbi:MAG: stage II sporulation protein R [Clostridia bacterium]|nr:stage II sporulation protein R [Clostridia bacterium]
MKKIISLFIGFIAVCGVFVGFMLKNSVSSSALAEGYLRIHIRANSNSSDDQCVKYKVKERVVDYLTPLIAEGTSFCKAYQILSDNLQNIERVADQVLSENGYDYTCKARLSEEYFPTRSYEEFTLENGYYDALILSLGTGTGDNWWCVVYPPLCFISNGGSGTKNIKYKSKLVEIVEKFFH